MKAMKRCSESHEDDEFLVTYTYTHTLFHEIMAAKPPFRKTHVQDSSLSAADGPNTIQFSRLLIWVYLAELFSVMVEVIRIKQK